MTRTAESRSRMTLYPLTQIPEAIFERGKDQVRQGCRSDVKDLRRSSGNFSTETRQSLKQMEITSELVWISMTSLLSVPDEEDAFWVFLELLREFRSSIFESTRKTEKISTVF